MSNSSYRTGGGDWRGWEEHFDQQLARLERLPEGSDTWIAHKPLPAVIEAAREVANDAGRHGAFVSIVSATSEGAIQLKWQNQIAEFSLFLYADRAPEYIFLTHDRSKRDSGDLPDIKRAGEFVSRHIMR